MGPDGEQSSHVASTVEMTSTIVPCKILSLTAFPLGLEKPGKKGRQFTVGKVMEF